MSIRHLFVTGSLILLVASLGLAPCVGDDERPDEGSAFTAVNAPLDELLQAAVAEGKPLLLLFDSEGCGWCKVLHDEVFSRSDVREELKKFVLAQYIEGHDAAKPVSERFHVRGFPTTLVLDAEGVEIDRVPGYKKPEGYLADLQRMLAGEDTLKSLLALGEQRSVGQARTLAEKLVYSDPKEAAAFCDEVVNGRSDLAEEDTAWFLLLRAEALANDESYEQSIETAERIVREYRATKAAKLAVVQIVIALINTPPERALRLLLTAPRPEDPKAQDYLDNHAMILHLRAAEAGIERQAHRHAEDAEMLNILAWECYQRELSTKKAIEWARSAVDQSDRAPHILDTLAHLLFRENQVDEAITLESEALERASSDEERWEYEEALAKFKAVKAVRERRAASKAGASGDEATPQDK